MGGRSGHSSRRPSMNRMALYVSPFWWSGRRGIYLFRGVVLLEPIGEVPVVPLFDLLAHAPFLIRADVP